MILHFNNYLAFFLCLFMLIHYSRVVIPSLFQHCIQTKEKSRQKVEKEKTRIWKGKGKVPVAFYSIIIFHPHYGCWWRDFSLSLLFSFFGINIHTRFVWCYSYLLLSHFLCSVVFLLLKNAIINNYNRRLHRAKEWCVYLFNESSTRQMLLCMRVANKSNMKYIFVMPTVCCSVATSM